MRKLLILLTIYLISCKASAQLFEVKGKNYLRYKTIDSIVSSIEKGKLFLKNDTSIIGQEDFPIYAGKDFVKYYYNSQGKLLKVYSNQVNKDTSVKCTYYFRNGKPIKIVAETFVKKESENFAAYYLGDHGEEIYSKRDYDVSDLGDYYRSAKKYQSSFIVLMLKSKVN